MTRIIDERRQHERVEANLDALWEGVLIRHTGTVVDISATGCFILTQDDVKPKELVRLEVVLPDGRRIYLWGEVVYQIPEMGFAVQYTGTDESEHELLEEFLASVKSVREAADPVEKAKLSLMGSN
jgi:hypothetical protein